MRSMMGKISGGRGTLILVRHAHTAMAGTFCGQIDPPLDEEGIAQLLDLRARLSGEGLTHIFSSDLQRARQTAEAIAESRHLHVHKLVSLREIAFGSWEGLNWDQVMAQDSAYAQRWLDQYPSVPAPGGEGLEDFLHRIQGAMNEVADQVQDGRGVVVTHGGVIRTFLGYIAGLRESATEFSNLDYTSCWEARRQGRHWMVQVPLPLASQCQAATL